MRSLPPNPASLWRHADFLKLWAGTALADTGGAITALALPLVAIATLGAGPAQMGLLIALRQAPVPLLGLFVGVWVDRRARRPLVIGTRVGYALLIVTIPAAAWMDVLRIELLYGVAFVLGAFGVVFELAQTSYLPSLVARGQLVAGNARLQLTHSAAAVTGPGLGGLVVQTLGAPVALAFDCLGSLAAAAGVALIRRPEPARTPTGERGGVGREIVAGARMTLGQPVIAAMTLCSMIGSTAGALQQSVFLLFLANELELSPAWLGLVVASAGAAALVAALLAHPAARRFGSGPVMVAASFLWFAGAALVPLAGHAPLPPLLVLVPAQALIGFALTAYSINQISLRQALTPDALLGRVNATRRVLVFGVIPIGALAGGAIGEALGLRAALMAAAAVSFLAFVYAAASPLRTTRGAGPL